MSPLQPSSAFLPFSQRRWMSCAVTPPPLLPGKPVVIENNAELNKAFFAGRCDSLTSDASQLAAIRSVAPNPDDYIILPEIISKEPLAPVVRHGDDQWYDIVNWSVNALN